MTPPIDYAEYSATGLYKVATHWHLAINGQDACWVVLLVLWLMLLLIGGLATARHKVLHTVSTEQARNLLT